MPSTVYLNLIMDAWVVHKDIFYGDLQNDGREGGIGQLRTVRLWGTHGLSGRGTWVRHDDQMQGSSYSRKRVSGVGLPDRDSSNFPVFRRTGPCGRKR